MFLEIDELAERLEDEDSNVRQEACYLLSKIETVASANLLAGAMRDNDPRVRVLAKKGLDRLAHLGFKADPKLLENIPPVILGTGTSKKRLTLEPPPKISPAGTPPGRPQIPPAQKTKSGSPVNRIQLEKSDEGSSVPKFSLRLSKSPVQTAISPSRLDEPGKSQPSPISRKAPGPPLKQPPAEATKPTFTFNLTSGKSVTPESPPKPVAESAVVKDEPSERAPTTSVPQKESSPDRANERKTGHPVSASSETVAPVSAVDPADPEWLQLIKSSTGRSFEEHFACKSAQEKIDLLSQIEVHKPEAIIGLALNGFIDSEKDPFVLSKLIKVFARHSGSGCVQRLEPFLEHDDSRVVSNCLEAIAVIGGSKEIQLIIQFLDHPEARIRSTAANSLWQHTPEQAMEVIKKMAFSKQVWEKDAAKFALENCSLPEAQTLLEQLNQTLPKVSAQENQPLDPGMPPLLAKLGRLGKVLNFPVAIGLDEPVPLWMFCLGVCFVWFFFFNVALPVVDYLIPPP